MARKKKVATTQTTSVEEVVAQPEVKKAPAAKQYRCIECGGDVENKRCKRCGGALVREV